MFVEKKTNQNESTPLLNKKTIGVKEDVFVKGLGDKTPQANCLSNLFFTWLTPILRLGNMRPLEFSDLYQLNKEDRSRAIGDLFQLHWQKSHSVFWALFLAFGQPFAMAGLLKLIHDSLQFVGPMIIKLVIQFLDEPQAPVSQGLIYAGIIFVSGVVQSFCLRQYFYYCYLVGMRFRSAIVTAVYKKSLVLSSSARQQKTAGEITNLMSVDAQRLQDLTPYLHGIWYGFYQIIVSCVLLWRELGPSCLAGVAVIILVIPVTSFMSNFMRSLQKKLMEVKDDRIKICYEMLSGMKVIKLQGWETSFNGRVMDYRTNELSKLRTYIYSRSAIFTIYGIVPSLVAVASFLSFILLGNKFDVGVALTSLALFNILRFPLFMLPQVINNLVEASVSFKRLTDFFNQEERVKVSEGDLTTVSVKIEEADFTWGAKDPKVEDKKEAGDNTQSPKSKEKESEVILKDISLTVSSGELCAIVGHVGSGKSTLLSGILGDARCIKGKVSARGSVSYVSQQPFIQNATLRENICFGLPFEEARYQNAIDVSALKADLQVLPGGDMTEIGEKGINLSGGQRTRVSIARAVYQDTDIYVLDDPLSAVDSHVGKQIFTNCILNALKDKLVLFVTNGMTFLNQSDHIVVLENGRIAEEGSYSSLMKNEGLLFSMVQTSKEGDQDGENVSEENNAVPTDNESAHEGFSKITSRRATSLSEAGDGDESGNGQLMTDEDRSMGAVSWTVYKQWIRSAGGMFVGFLIILLFIVTQGVTLSSTVWISYWSKKTGDTAGMDANMFYLYVYIGINLLYSILTFSRVLVLFSCGLRASKSIFQSLLTTVLRAPMSFFDTTPLGRIINRLSKDIYSVDEQIPGTWNMYLNTLISVLSTIATISYVTPEFLVVMVPVCIGYYLSQRYFIKSSRELQRLDSISRSPVYALLGETLDGLPTIHAYNAESRFQLKNDELLDKNQRAYYLNFSANCWLALRLEFAGTIISTAAALAAVLQHGNPNEYFAGLAGVSLSYAFSVTQSLNWSVRMISQLQTQMVSVERINTYTDMPREASLESTNKPPGGWPGTGLIEFRDVRLRYRAGLPLVLRGLNLVIRGEEKVGVVGRTGAGKSSLVVALMRLVEIDAGSILIDGIDCATLGLHELRRRISIIPQDPVLFSGSVRSNLDPFDQYEDVEIWESIKRVQLQNVVKALDGKVEESGSNFSVGERQLLCIARALLRKSKIILMDEATASIDVKTDQLIQRSIREEFADRTCLTIAHRINTIMDSDRVLVMDKGKVAEFDTPQNLLKQNGIFKSLVDHWREEEEH